MQDHVAATHAEHFFNSKLKVLNISAIQVVKLNKKRIFAKLCSFYTGSVHVAMTENYLELQFEQSNLTHRYILPGTQVIIYKEL